MQALELPAVLDLAWARDGGLLAVATDGGARHLLRHAADGLEAAATVHHPDGAPGFLSLALDWSDRVHARCEAACAGSAGSACLSTYTGARPRSWAHARRPDPMIAVSDSRGGAILWALAGGAPAQAAAWHAHDLEVWAVAFDGHQPSTVFTGACATMAGSPTCRGCGVRCATDGIQ